MNLDRRIGSALYADDGAIWARGLDPTCDQNQARTVVI